MLYGLTAVVALQAVITLALARWCNRLQNKCNYLEERVKRLSIRQNRRRTTEQLEDKELNP